MQSEDKKSDEAKLDLKEFEQTPDVKQEIGGVSVDPVAQKVVEQEKEVSEEDRSAFNCEPCKGEGLKDEGTLCPSCNGTGKV